MATKIRNKNSANAIAFAKSYEIVSGKSATIPEQSISPREMLERYRKGLPVSGKRVTFYDADGSPEEMEMPDLKKMDLVEINEMMEANRQHIQKLRDELDKAQLASNEQEQYKKYRERYEKEIASIKAEEKNTSADAAK